MQIIPRKISELVPYEHNPRINDPAVGPVAASIKEFGFRVPIMIDAGNIIIAGHTRYKAALELGMDEVPCIVADDLTPDQIRAFRIADNKTSEYATWDFDALAEEMDELRKAGFDLLMTGFAQEAIDDILDALEPPRDIEDDDFDEDVDPSEQPFSQPGDIWLMNGHRVMCGDSTSADQVAILMNGGKAHLCITDPPYNVAYIGKTAASMKIKNDDMSDAEYYEFLLSAHKNIADSLTDGGSVYVFHADSEGANVRNAFIDSGLKLAQCCIWVKNSMVMGRQDYQWQHEPVLYGWKPTGKHHWYADRSQTTIWNFDRPTRNIEHPTMKPIPLLAYPIQNSSRKENVVLDLFGGSGSTLIACNKTGRKCYMMEVDPLYCDLIVRRYIRDTEDMAVQIIRDGETIEFASISERFRI